MRSSTTRLTHDYRYIEINRALRRLHPSIVAAVIAGLERASKRSTRGSCSFPQSCSHQASFAEVVIEA